MGQQRSEFTQLCPDRELSEQPRLSDRSPRQSMETLSPRLERRLECVSHDHWRATLQPAVFGHRDRRRRARSLWNTLGPSSLGADFRLKCAPATGLNFGPALSIPYGRALPSGAAAPRGSSGLLGQRGPDSQIDNRAKSRDECIEPEERVDGHISAPHIVRQHRCKCDGK